MGSVMAQELTCQTYDREAMGLTPGWVSVLWHNEP